MPPRPINMTTPQGVTIWLMSMVLLTAPTSLVAQDVLVGVATPADERVLLSQIDHAPWNTLLQTYVTDEGQVNYRGWKASAESLAQLNSYLATLSTANLKAPATQEQKLAYWINAYNAVTNQGILREYPTTSIRNHTPKLWGYHIWKNLKLQAGGKPINLNDIEHEVLRKMGDPRVHFAIVCASIGCPRLLNEAYTPEGLEEQLNRNARHFFAQPQNFRIDTPGGTVHLSAILKWFATDFGPDQTAQLRQFSVWLPNDAARTFLAQPGIKVRHQKYDWNLNGQ